MEFWRRDHYTWLHGGVRDTRREIGDIVRKHGLLVPAPTPAIGGRPMRAKNSEQEDHLLRMIQQLGRAIARLREMLTGSAVAGQTVRAEVAQSTGLLLGADAAMLEQLDAVSAVRLVGSAPRVELWAQLLDLESETWTREGDVERAAAVATRAAALRAAAAQ